MWGKLFGGIVAGIVITLSSTTYGATVSLVGTELKLDALAQATPTSPQSRFAAMVSAIVSDTEVEYPNVNDFGFTDVTIPGFPRPVTTVPVAIDAGADFLEIDFDNTSPFNFFVAAFQNTYIFTFADIVAPRIVEAEIDTDVTTLGLAPEDVTFLDNQLFVNVEGLTFDTSTFARINLTAVPLPAALPLMLSGVVGLGVLARWKRKA